MVNYDNIVDDLLMKQEKLFPSQVREVVESITKALEIEAFKFTKAWNEKKPSHTLAWSVLASPRASDYTITVSLAWSSRQFSIMYQIHEDMWIRVKAFFVDNPYNPVVNREIFKYANGLTATATDSAVRHFASAIAGIDPNDLPR